MILSIHIIMGDNMNSCKKNINDKEKTPSLCDFESYLEEGKTKLESHNKKIKDLINELNIQNSVSVSGANNVNISRVNDLYNEIDFYKKTYFSPLTKEYNNLYSKVKHNYNPESKQYQDEIDKKYKKFYNKSVILNAQHKELEKIKKQYDSAEAMLSSSNQDTNRLISFLWLILTITIVIFTVKAFITKRIHPFIWILALIFIHSVLFSIIKNLF
jgi:transketolase